VSTAGRERLAALDELSARACACTRCPELVRSRTQVVFGSCPPAARLMFVGEAPGTSEDRDGVPLAGAASRLLDELLAAIGLRRADVAVVNLVKCRPPDNRNPLRAELESCQEYLFGQLELLQPAVLCPLGNFATRVLRGENTPIVKLRGTVEVRAVGPRTVRLYPLLHPAAALYSPASVEQLRADVARIPELLALGAPEQPEPQPEPEPVAEIPSATEPADAGEPGAPEPDNPQLGLF
jgi:uracil-DNA glycosylase family 4